jgi:dTDP-4-dehydrorhamnose reductase
MNTDNKIEIWGGLECTINRVQDSYNDQLEYCGHYNREDDIKLVASLGIKMLRYPIVWERHQPQPGINVNWECTEKKLEELKETGVKPIAGLVHHGSGPRHVNFFDGSFESGLAEYARYVAEKFPWIEYYTPVNEPLTTARFCGLYGHWYPHLADEYSFYKILMSECKATIMAMKAIQKVNPQAKLIQTEDLGKTYSTPLLAYQAHYENERRWLSYELLCGTLTPDKLMWKRLVDAGIDEKEIEYFLHNNCKPHIAGFNYYITSERYLDEDLSKYPEEYHGGNDKNTYADIEIVKVPLTEDNGPYTLIREAWERLNIPLAITECHLHSTREEQMRWFNDMYETVSQLRTEGVDIRAITAWAIFGLYGWNRLVTQPWGDYEPGVFNLSTGRPRPTALARLIRVLTKHKVYYHPVLETEGWWQRDIRLLPSVNHNELHLKGKKHMPKCQPVLIVGKSGTLGTALSKVCEERNIHHILLSRTDLNITDREMFEQFIEDLNPWAIINAAGYVKVDEAEDNRYECFKLNTEAPQMLADICSSKHIKFLTYSSGLVFDGTKTTPYTESDEVSPISVYGLSKAKGEEEVMANNPNALIIRTCSFFSPWDNNNFVTITLDKLKNNIEVEVADDIYISPTYVPDLVHESLDLLLDNESGIYHVVNEGRISWANFALRIAEMAGLDASLIKAMPARKINFKAGRPHNSLMISEKGIKLPSFEKALERYFETADHVYVSNQVAV